MILWSAWLSAKVWVAPSFNEVLIHTNEDTKFAIHYNIGNNNPEKAKVFLSYENGSYFFKKNIKDDPEERRNDPPLLPPAVSDWLEYNGETEFELRPMEQKRLTFYALCTEDSLSEMNANLSFTIDDGGMVKSGISVPLYVIIKERAQTDFSIRDIQFITNRRDGEYYVAGIRMRFKNNSNIHLRPEVDFSISDVKDNAVTNIFLGELAPIFEQGDIYYSCGLDIRLKPGSYHGLVRARYFFKQLEITTKITIDVDSSGRLIIP